MKINIVEHADGSEGVFIRGNVMDAPPETAEYRTYDGKIYVVKVQGIKVILDIEDTKKPGTEEPIHEQPGS